MSEDNSNGRQRRERARQGDVRARNIPDWLEPFTRAIPEEPVPDPIVAYLKTIHW